MSLILQRIAAVALFLGAMFASGCSQQRSADPSPSAGREDSSHSAFADCSPDAARRAILGFFAAFNRGEQDLVNRFMSAPENWIWWRDPENMQTPVRRDLLESRLKELRQTGLTFELADFYFTGRNSVHPICDFGFHFRVHPAGRKGNAKGSVSRKDGRIALLTIDQWPSGR
ncbi:hypothetical protein [Microtetraspora malaysiensis]|uniref:hypothetical protein n=1 Tax=Microtetraspora malaysiensis TaxID=161358 RepID=UPI003D89E1FB